MRITTNTTKIQFFVFMGAVITLSVIAGIIVGVAGKPTVASAEDMTTVQESEYMTETEEITTEPVEIETEEESTTVEDGFTYYEIPEVCTQYGGSFPEELQRYAWEICEERELDFSILVALIERESGYKQDATGDNGDSKGYMQIQEKWHYARMEEEGATDLYNPYENIRVGLSYLDDLYEKYGSWNLALMAYNMGETRAKNSWDKGIYETDYSRYIERRAEEIKQELN